jgi:Amidohydrolase family
VQPADHARIPVSGFVDHHTHLLAAAAGVPFPWQGGTVRAFHERVHRDGNTPMDVPEPAADNVPAGELARRLHHGLSLAAGHGLVEVTEMGMRDWRYLDALAESGNRPLPARVRIYLASGLAERSGTAELAARRAGCGPWVRLDGVKFYADGWLVPRTCAMCVSFDDEDTAGILFADAASLASRIEPFAAAGWRIATHAIGDRAVQAVLDAYELAWGGDRGAVAAPRIEHGSVLSDELISRIAELGVFVCIQPSFAVTDAAQVPLALGAGRAESAYPWASLAAAGASLLSGTDYPIEVIEPLVGMARLVTGGSLRPGFLTDVGAPPHSRLPAGVALAISTDRQAGLTFLSADPAKVEDADLDKIEVHGTEPAPFRVGLAGRLRCGAPFGCQQRVHRRVAPFALEPDVLAEVRLAPHPEPLAEPGGGVVAGIDLREDAVHAQVGERQHEQLPRGLGGEPATVVVGVQRPADLGLAVGQLAGLDQQVTDHAAVVLDRQDDLVLVGPDPRRGHPVGDERRRAAWLQRIGRHVPDDVRPAAVGEHVSLVAVPERPQHKPLGPARQYRRGRGDLGHRCSPPQR